MISTLPGYEMMFFFNKQQVDICKGVFFVKMVQAFAVIFLLHRIIWKYFEKITVVEELLHMQWISVKNVWTLSLLSGIKISKSKKSKVKNPANWLSKIIFQHNPK